jgi:hypothetical protein
MKSLLVHGCYDLETFRILKAIGVRNFGFDMRPLSPNLVTFSELKKILNEKGIERGTLVFENEKLSTIASSVDILKEFGASLDLEFRDSQSSQYYSLTGLPFSWVWRPEGDWRNILELPNLNGIILPTRSRSTLLNVEFWETLQQKEIEVFIHADSFGEAQKLAQDPELCLSLDLGAEFETSYRKIDHNKLRNHKLWSLQ